MGAPTVPPVIPQPFANNNPTLRNTIPNTTVTPGVASWDQGWPADTMQPVVAGGVPPFGQDFNGLEFALSSHDYYVQAGALFPFQAAVATAIGGYGVGALLGSVSDPDIVWFNTVANNSTDPDSGGAAGWVSLWAYGFDTHNGLIGGASPLNLTNIQASRKFVVLNGALTGNLTVNLPANILKDWLFINNTSGAFTTTVKTATGGSVGVTVPQGGWSNPLGVYSDGTNVYPTVAPLGVPISQSNTPLTLAERDNSGNLIATYFQGLSAFESPSTQPFNGFIGLGPDQSLLRKYRTSDVEAALALSSIGGAVTAGQVPLSAVIQYAANILANAALTGVPTTPTAAIGTSNAQVASTAFANPGNSLTNPGYYRFPGGLILQLGGPVASGTTITFGTTGGTIGMTILAVVALPIAGGAVQCWLSANPVGGHAFTVNTSGGTAIWIAIGH